MAATRALLAAISSSCPRRIKIQSSTSSSSSSCCSILQFQRQESIIIARSFSSDTNSSPNISRLAETARISLTPAEVHSSLINRLCFSKSTSCRKIDFSLFVPPRLRNVNLRFVKSSTGTMNANSSMYV